MIPLAKTPTTRGALPEVETAPEGRVQTGGVYVVIVDAIGSTERLPNGKRVVLETTTGYLELITQEAVAGGMEVSGTYLNAADVVALGADLAEPTLRLYTVRDTLAKVWSFHGLLLAIPAAIGILLAAAGIWFATAGKSPTDAATVAARARTTLEWAVEPANRLDASATPAEVVQARREVMQRAVQASRCLDNLRGQAAPLGVVPGVTCTATSPVWYRDKKTAAWITLVAGLLTAVAGALALWDRFGFRKSPTGS